METKLEQDEIETLARRTMQATRENTRGLYTVEQRVRDAFEQPGEPKPNLARGAAAVLALLEIRNAWLVEERSKPNRVVVTSLGMDELRSMIRNQRRVRTSFRVADCPRERLEKVRERAPVEVEEIEEAQVCTTGS